MRSCSQFSPDKKLMFLLAICFSLFAYLYFCNIICVFVFFNCIFALSFVYLYLCIIICLFVFVYLQKSKKKEHSRPVSRQEVDILARQQKDEKCVLFEWPRFKNISFLTQFEFCKLSELDLINLGCWYFQNIVQCENCISKENDLTFSFVNFYETLPEFENLSEGLNGTHGTFSNCLLLISPGSAVLREGLPNVFISFLIFASSATRGLWGRAYLAEEPRLFGSRKRHKLGAEEEQCIQHKKGPKFLIHVDFDLRNE